MSPRKSRSEWARIVDEFEQSGLTHRQFSDAHGLTLATFRQWLYRLRRDDSPKLVPVHVVSRPTTPDACVIIEAGDARVHVRAGTDVDYVVDLVRGLAS